MNIWEHASRLVETPQTRWVLIICDRDYAEAYGPFGTEQMANKFKENMIASGTDEGDELEYEDRNGNVYIGSLTVPSAASVMGTHKP